MVEREARGQSWKPGWGVSGEGNSNCTQETSVPEHRGAFCGRLRWHSNIDEGFLYAPMVVLDERDNPSLQTVY